MGQSRIIIESTGSHHNGKPNDADKVARDTVATLQAMGHSDTKAEFQLRAFDEKGEKAEPYQVDNLLPDVVEEAAAGLQAGVGADGEVGNAGGDLAAGVGTAADAETGATVGEEK